MSDVEHVLTSSSDITVGPSRARQARSRVGRDFRRASRKVATGAMLVAGDAIAVWLAERAEQVVLNWAFPSGSAAQWQGPPIVVLLLIFLTLGLYSGLVQSPIARLRTRGIGILLFVAFQFSATGITAGSVRAIAEPASYASFLLAFGFYAELLLRHVLVSTGLWMAPTALVGCGNNVRQLYQTLATQPELGFRPIGFVRTPSDADVPDGALPAPVLGRIEDFARVSEEVEVAILTAGDQLALANAISGHPSPAQLILLNDAPDLQTMGVSLCPLGNVVGIRLHQTSFLSQNQLLKRMIDLAIAIPAAILSLPLIAILVLLISLVDRGSPFFHQPRIGRGGRTFNVPKLRTMYNDAAQRLEKHLEQHPSAQDEWQRYFKLSNDPRILPVIGNFIRRMSLDELPQLWSVIIGEMSLVGPRPFPHYHLRNFDGEFQKNRTIVPPGLTGLWQITARSDGDLDVQRAQDMFYIRNWSIWLDLYILLKTLPAIMIGKGAR